MFVNETLLSLVATWRQQERNPLEELKRVVQNIEMLAPGYSVPAVAFAG